MHWLDTSSLFVMVGFAGIGLVMGLLGPLVRIGLIGLAFLIASYFTPQLIAAINKKESTGESNTAVLSLLFVVTLTLLLSFFVLIRRWIWNSAPEFADSIAKFGWLDRLLGVFAGGALGFTVIGLLLCLSIRVCKPEQNARYQGSRMFEEAMKRIEPVLLERPAAEQEAVQPIMDWLRKLGEKKTPASAAPGSSTPAAPSTPTTTKPAASNNDFKGDVDPIKPMVKK